MDYNKLWKILKEMGIPDHLTCFLRNLYGGQEATVRTGHRKRDWFWIVKGVHQGWILSPCLFNFMQSTSWETLGWMKHKLESRLPGEISITSDIQMTPPLAQKWRRTIEPLDETAKGEWKSRFKTQHPKNEDHGIRSHHLMANRWGNSDRLYILGSKITADSDCSHEIKRRLLLGRKVMTNLDSILKSRHYFANKSPSSQSYGFSSSHVCMWELD